MDTIGAEKRARHMRNYRHGLAKLKRAVTKLGSRAIDGRSKLSYALKRWQRDLIEDLGGEDNISTQQRAIIELAATSKLILGSIDAWILSQPTLFTRNKTLLPVVTQRQQLADGLARHLVQLGLARRHKVTTLQEILANDDDHQGNGNGAEKESNEQAVALSFQMINAYSTNYAVLSDAEAGLARIP